MTFDSHICRDNANDPGVGRSAIRVYLNDIAHPISPVLNDRQSTHTGSVHTSVSDSAQRLLLRYGKQCESVFDECVALLDSKIALAIDFPSGANKAVDAFITELIQEALQTEPNAAQHRQLKASLDKEFDERTRENLAFEFAAAKRCLVRLMGRDSCLDFEDATSKVSIRQLLALIFKAIDDDKMRELGVFRTRGLLALIRGFYRIQRGYNLNDVGVDDKQAEDWPVCVSGTFNALIDALIGIHPDFCVIFITQKSINLKFPEIVRECLIAYLKSLPRVTTKEECDCYNTLLHDLVGEGMSETLWGVICGEVKRKIFDEFESFYKEAEAPALLDLLSTGREVGISQDCLSQNGLVKRVDSRRSVLFAKTRGCAAEDDAISELQCSKG